MYGLISVLVVAAIGLAPTWFRRRWLGQRLPRAEANLVLVLLFAALATATWFAGRAAGNQIGVSACLAR
ncbi:hypothetical protein [Actinophytocola oryzae]|uniref:Uncharacterized protein n=1 Tax=Actinophytocola oryzae TaxID=502181 RepID=A0A4R7VJY0_9PSEU|nr:hypothetical protein [Actinophytocola oryzae]TDV49776.1 hypothetical protein CLV71_107123 [Actinophytocola oryzae]